MMATNRVVYMGTAPAIDANDCQGFIPSQMDDLERALMLAMDHAGTVQRAGILKILKKVGQARK